MNLRLHNIILVANPCHVTPGEHAFWRSVAAQAQQRGWHLVEVATRALPYTELAESVSLPARLSDVFAKLPTSSEEKTKLPPWISSDYVRVLEDWEYRRWGLGERLPASLYGLLRLIVFVDDAVKLVQPSSILTTNKIDHGVTLFREAGLYHGISTQVVERSPLDSIWLESEGLFRESEIWSLYSRASLGTSSRLAELGESYIRKLAKNPHGFRAGAATRFLPRRLKALDRPIVFLPMDNVLWTGWEQADHPMREVDNPLYSSPREAMEELLDHVRALGGTLVVKPHPACLAIHKDSIPKGAILVEGDLNSLLAAVDLVVTFNTKVAFPALALGCPVVTLAPNPVAASGATYHCLERSRVRRILQQALVRDNLKARLGRFPPFVGWLAHEFFYDCNETSEPTQRGPRRFVEDLLVAAGEPEKILNQAEVNELTRELRILGAAAPPKRPSQSPKKEPVRPSMIVASSAGGTATRIFRLKQRARNSLLAKAARTLRNQGARELGRKTVLWVLPHFGKKTLSTVVAALERSGVKVDELKAKLPYMVQYRREWNPAKAVPYARLFQQLWYAPQSTESRLPTRGCSATEVARLRRLRHRYKGGRTVILGDSMSPLPEDATTFATDGAFLGLSGEEPAFYTTTDLKFLPELDKQIRTSKRTLFFLPWKFFGLVPANRRIFWFEQGCLPWGGASEPLSWEEGTFSGGSTLEAAAELAWYLGFKRFYLSLSEPLSESGFLERLQRLLDAAGGEVVLLSSKGTKAGPVAGYEETIVIDFDVKRLVDASISRKPHQGITRYTLRLFQELKRLEGEVVINPVYLHPLDPKRIGLEKAVTEAAGLDAVAALFGEDVNILWKRHPVMGALLRAINGLERHCDPKPNQIVHRMLCFLQKRLILRSFRVLEGASIVGQIFHSPVNPLPPRRLTKNHLRVVTVHDCIFLKFPELYPSPGRVPAIRKTLDSIDPKIDFVICDSENSRRDLHSFLEIDSGRTTVVPLSADPQFFHPDKKKGRARLEAVNVPPRKYLVALAQSEPRKNISRLVESYQRFLRQHPQSEVELVLVTWESHRRALLSTLQAEGLASESIKVITDVDDATLSGLFALALGMLYVPLYEGFGMPPLEAMASGCPVIVADNSSLPEVVGDAGIYVDAEDIEGIASAIAELASDPIRRRDLSSRSLARAANFSWERTARMTLDFYREMLNGSSQAIQRK